MKCPICGGEQKKIEEKSFVKGFEILAEFYRCEACGEELMTEGQFRKGMDKIIELKAEVYSIERQKELYLLTKKFLPKVGYVSKKLVFGDGYLGLPDNAPFDGIIVTAGAPYVPKPLLSQLKIGGRLVIPVGKNTQVMTLYTRKGEKEFDKQEYGDFRFVPLLKDSNK